MNEIPPLLPARLQEAGSSIVDPDMVIVGTITIGNRRPLIVRGRVEGEISTDGIVAVAEGGSIRGKLRTAGLVVAGLVEAEGDVEVRGLLDLRATGSLAAARVGYGDLQLERGASIACQLGPIKLTDEEIQVMREPGGAQGRGQERVVAGSAPAPALQPPRSSAPSAPFAPAGSVSRPQLPASAPTPVPAPAAPVSAFAAATAAASAPQAPQAAQPVQPTQHHSTGLAPAPAAPSRMLSADAAAAAAAAPRPQAPAASVVQAPAPVSSRFGADDSSGFGDSIPRSLRAQPMPSTVPAALDDAFQIS